MKHMVRTKIKGNSTVDSSDDGRTPNFDNLPPLPVCNKQPSDVLNEMENVNLKLQSSPGAMADRDLTMAPLSCPKPTNFNGATTHQMVLPRNETPCNFSVNYNQEDQSLLLPGPPPLPFRDDNEICDDFANFIQGAIQQVEGYATDWEL